MIKTSITLTFHRDDLDPDTITRLIGKAPTQCTPKGVMSVIYPGALPRPAPTGYWGLSVKYPPTSDMPVSDIPACDIDVQIADILAGTTLDLDVWNELSISYNGRISVGVFLQRLNSGFSLAPHTLELLYERKLKIDFDIYSHYEE